MVASLLWILQLHTTLIQKTIYSPRATLSQCLIVVGPVIFRDRGKVAEFAELPT